METLHNTTVMGTYASDLYHIHINFIPRACLTHAAVEKLLHFASCYAVRWVHAIPILHIASLQSIRTQFQVTQAVVIFKT